MGVNLPFVADPNQDPYLLNINAPSGAIDPTQDPNLQVTDNQSAPGLASPALSGGAPFSAATVPLSGDAYAPQPAQSATTDTSALPFSPTTSTGPPGFAGWATDTVAPSSAPAGPPGFAGWPEATAKSAMPQAQPASPTGPPSPTYGNDIAGSILSAESRLPGGTNTQAFIHGAQAQAVPTVAGFAGMLIGGAIGSLLGPLGSVAGGFIGAYLGGYLGGLAQNELGKNLVPTQTNDALRAQTQYEQTQSPLFYAAGGLAPQALMFRPSPTNLTKAFGLIGKTFATPGMAEKIALLKLPENREAVNTLMIMGIGTGQTAYNAQQEIAQGNFNPLITAINLIGATTFTKPTRWIQGVVPMLREPVQQVQEKGQQEIRAGYDSTLNPDGDTNPEAQKLAQAVTAKFQEATDLLNQGRVPEATRAFEEHQQMLEQLQELRNPATAPTSPVAQELLDMVRGGQITKEEANQRAAQQRIPDWKPLATESQIAPQAVISPIDPRAQELIDEVNAGTMSAADADKIAAQQNIPNWESQVAKQGAEIQSRGPALENQALGGESFGPGQRQAPEDFTGGFNRAVQGVAAQGGDLTERAPVSSMPEASLPRPTPEQLQEAVRRAQEFTKANVAPQVENAIQTAREVPPEPRKETTPGGISTGIRAAVDRSPAASAASQALIPLGDVHVVGGAIRNLIAGKPIKDLDLTFSGSEDKLVQGLSSIGDAEFSKTGEQFPVYRLRVGDDEVEIALHRTENPENQQSFATGENIPISEDLQRRDFTINSMAVDVKTGAFIDPNNGLKHSQSQSLALVNPKSFAGDPVRMLRALRFIGDGYHPGKALLASMKENAPSIANVPPERIQTELDRVFSSEKPGKALEAMRESGLLAQVFPEHLKTIGFDQRSTHHTQLLWDHIMGVVNKTAELNPDPDVRMAAFLHDISKPDTQAERPGTGGKMSYLGHEDVGAATTKRILTSLKYSNDRIDRIEFLVKNHMFQQQHVMAHPAGFIHDMSKDLMSVPPADRQAIVDQRINDLFTIREADQANHPVNKADIKGMREALDSIGQKPIGRPANNIDGNDLIDLGLKPGPEFSRILKTLDHEVLYDNLPNEPETLINRAKELAGIKAVSLQARRLVPHEEDPWPAVRRAVLEHGGIGPSRDWPKDWIPGDLYRADGKAPDLVASEATIGRADTPPWGDNKSDSDMMTYLRSAWEQHVKFQQQRGSYQPAIPVPDTTGHVNHLPLRGTGVRGSNPEVRNLATQYTQSVGLPSPEETAPVVVNKEKAARLAKFYEQAQSDPTNPEVQAAYRAFNEETQKQWDMATRAGYKFEAWDKPGQPYANSAAMRADVLNNKHLYYFKTSEGSPPHALTTEAQNDKFRAVHDLFGHAMNGNEFGPTGEENAWVEHSKMYSPLAQKAMTTETRAQNSTVNFGTHGEFNRANPGKTIYPDQKAVVPPGEFLPGQRMTLTHYSAKARTEINPEHQGESGLSSELNRTGPNENKAARFASYYEQGQQPERFFGSGSSFPVKHTVTGDYKILDLNSPEAARLRRETAANNRYGLQVAHEFDDAAQAAGYDGYKRNGTVRLFGKQPVSHINDVPITPQEGQTEFTARLGQGQGEQNGLQQETTGQREAPGQTGIGSETGLGSQASDAGQISGEELTSPTTGNEIGNARFGTANESAEGATTLNLSHGLEGGDGGTATSAVYAPATGTGNIRTNAGDAARIVGAAVHTPTGRDATGRPIGTATGNVAAPDFSPTSRATRDRQAAQLGTTNGEQSAQAGSAGWTSSSDVEQKFIQAAHDLAQKIGVDLTQAPPFRGNVRMLPEEHQELVRFSQKPNNETKAGNVPLNKANLFIPDDPALVPGAFPIDARDWPTLMTANKLVDAIRLHQNGNPTLEYLPAKITDDATRVALILKGWAKRFFYDNAKAFPDSLSWDGASPGARERWRASQPTFGDRNSVIINARSVVAHNSRIEAGVYRKAEIRDFVPAIDEPFDPKIFQDLIDNGIIKGYSRKGGSIDNLIRASEGLSPESLKVGDYAGAMNGEARAPVDMWRARLVYGKENTPTTKMYEYEFGRNNFLTRMFSAHDPSILPSHIQSAEWFGYQQHVSERLAEIKQAAMATGDANLIRMAKSMRQNLESKDLAEVFRDRYGLTPGAKSPILPFDKILSNPNHRGALINISRELFTRRYLKGRAGAPTRTGGTKDVLDIQEGRSAWRGGDAMGALSDLPKLTTELANYYKAHWIDSKTVRSGPDAAMQSLNRNIGPIAERLARAAYTLRYPSEAAGLGKMALDLANIAFITPREHNNAENLALNRYLANKEGSSDLDHLVPVLAELHDHFGIPRGLVGLRVFFADEGGFANFNGAHPNDINVNAKHFNYLDFVRGQLAPLLENQLKRPEVQDLKGSALAKVKRVIAGYVGGNDATVARLVLGHELGHAIQFRIYGPEILELAGAHDYQSLPAAVSLLSPMTPKYMTGLVREGLGNELEALLVAHSSSINEYLGGVKGAPAKETMPLNQAVINILEHQTHQWSQFMKLPHAEYSWATPEVFRRNVYEPEVAEANYKELGKIWQKAIADLHDPLAVEAESQLSGRGPNPAIDSSLPTAEETSAGVAAYARLPEGNAFQAGTSGWFDSSSANQDVAQLLTHGERMLNIKATADALRERMASPMYKPVYGDRQTLADLDAKVNGLKRAIEVPGAVRMWPVVDPRVNNSEIPWLQKATEQAVARIQRTEGEGDRAYALRLVKASGAYTDLDHAIAVASAARDGVWAPVQYGDKVGFKVDNKFYKGTPGDHVGNWAGGFHDAIHTVIDNLPDRAVVDEPQMQGIGEIHPQDLSAAFADEFKPVAPNAKVGAASITSKGGEVLPVPSLGKYQFQWARNADIPSSQLAPASAANKVAAHFEAVQEGLDLSESLMDKGVFDPEPVIKENQRLAEAGEGGLPPPAPPGGSGGGREEPPIGGGGRPPKGMSPEERRDALEQAKIHNSALVLNGYTDAVKDSLKIEDPLHLRVTSGVNDIAAQIMKTFGAKEWYKDSRIWIIDASNAMRALAKAYGNVGGDITSRIAALELKSPGANDRIRAVQHASGQEARQALLGGMSDEEAYLANHLHNYWKLVGDVLMRAGITRTAVENYFPLMVEKEGKGFGSGESRALSQKTDHAVAKLKGEDGRFLFETPEDLQAFADDLGLGWKVRTGVGDVFMRQGYGVTRALTTKHTIDQLAKNSEVQVGKTKGEMAPPILTHSRYRDNPIVSDPVNRNQYVRGATVNGPWRTALTYTRWIGDHPVTEDYWVHRSLASVMERDTGSGLATTKATDEPGQSIQDRFRAMQGDDPLTKTAKTIGIANQLWKTWQFFLTPMHAFSLLGNLSTHAGANPFGVARFLTQGKAIVEDPAMRSRFYELIRAGAPNDSPELAGLQAKIPGYKPYHDAIWKTIMYNGTFGLADKLSQQHLEAWAANHAGEEITPQIRSEADKIGMEAAKKAMGSMNNMDMSKNWGLWGNVAFLANRWTTGQLRSVEEALGRINGPFSRMTGAVPLQGHDAESTAWMQNKSVEMSRQLLLGGMIRLAVVGTVASTAISALLNNGTPSTPFDNFQKDPARTFDIYAGRDPVTGKDKWYRMPFYLFQREMVDWVLSAVKANNEGREWFNKDNLGDSILAAPFVKFAGKLDPVTKLTLESLTGTELAGWMKGFSNSQIDSDTYITNLNKSLQMLGLPDGGSLENRFLNAVRQLSPSLTFPTNLPKPTNDFGQIMGSLGLGVGPLSFPTGDLGSQIAPFLGSSQMPGIKYSMGPDGKIQPAWQIQNYYDNRTQLGQQILQIASTLGTGTVVEEQQKLQQMEDLRQQAGFSPGQLTNLILHGDSQVVPGSTKGVLSQNLPPKTGIHTPIQLGGISLTPQQEVAYNSVTFQRQAQALAQAMADPTWKTMDASQRAAEVANLKAFADRITNEQFSIAMGIKKGPVVTTTQASSMIAEFGMIKKATQAGLLQSSIYTAAKPEDQATMMADRVSASENAVWEKYYGITSKMKGASDATLASYVALQSGLRDEVRALIEKLPTFTRSNDPAAQSQELKLALTFADNLVNQAIQGKAPRAFDSPLTQSQLVVAVRNGIILQDAALKQMHSSFIYQEAPQVDQLLLDSKYVTLAHNIALYDTRMGIQEGGIGNNNGFNAILSTTLAADEGYQTLVEQFFGTGGRLVLTQRENELADLKARFRQEYNVAPADLSRYDTLINNWYKQQNPDYAQFLYYRAQWEKYDPLGQAYRATIQSNLGFETSNPLALAAP